MADTQISRSKNQPKVIAIETPNKRVKILTQKECRKPKKSSRKSYAENQSDEETGEREMPQVMSDAEEMPQNSDSDIEQKFDLSEADEGEESDHSSQHSQYCLKRREILKMKKIAKIQRQLEDSAVEDMQVASMGTDTGSICSNIYHEAKEGSMKYTADVNAGSMVVKLSVYDFKKCLGTDPSQWWRHSPFRSSVVLSAKDYDVIMKVRELQLALKKKQKSIKGNKSTAVKKFSNH